MKDRDWFEIMFAGSVLFLTGTFFVAGLALLIAVISGALYE